MGESARESPSSEVFIRDILQYPINEMVKFTDIFVYNCKILSGCDTILDNDVFSSLRSTVLGIRRDLHCFMDQRDRKEF